MARLQTTVCDVCQNRRRPVRQYRITRNGAARSLELCEEHAATLEDLLAIKAKYADGSARRRTVTAATTMEEIERKKRAVTRSRG